MCAGVNGAGKTTQLQVILGKVQADSGEVIKAKRSMKIAYLAQVSAVCACECAHACVILSVCGNCIFLSSTRRASVQVDTGKVPETHTHTLSYCC